MDKRLLRFEVFSPKDFQMKKMFNRYGDKGVSSLLKYKDEPLRQSETIRQLVPSKLIEQVVLVNPNKQSITPLKLSYSNSIRYIDNYPEYQLDDKVVKLLQPRYLKSGFSTKRQREDPFPQHYQQQQISEDQGLNAIQYKFSQQAMKSQFKANMLYFKKSKNIPAQVSLLSKETEKKKFGTTLPTFKTQSKQDISMRFTTYREGFLKSQKSNLHIKQTQTRSTVKSNHQINHKKTNSVQTQILYDECGRDDMSHIKYKIQHEDEDDEEII